MRRTILARWKEAEIDDACTSRIDHRYPLRRTHRLAFVGVSLLFSLVIVNTLAIWQLVRDQHEEHRGSSDAMSTVKEPHAILSGRLATMTTTTTFEKISTNLPSQNQSSSSLSSLREHQLSNRHDNMTFGHAIPIETDVYLYPLPRNVTPEQRWRYRSNNVFWTQQDDPLYIYFHQQLLRMQLQQSQVGGIVPSAVRQHQREVAQTLKHAKLKRLEKIWNNAYPYTLEKTTFPLFDGTTYIITGDIPLMWLRDSVAQIQPYLPLLGESPELVALAEGVLRRQSLFIGLDPYATSFRLFLDHDFSNKTFLNEWDYASGRTLHVAMHNYELDNLAYHLRLSYSLFQYYQSQQESIDTTLPRSPMRALDDTWLNSFDLILDTVEREQNRITSGYKYPELAFNGIGNMVCDGDGLSWTGFRPSDERTKYGYLIPANQMMVVSLRNAATILESDMMLRHNATRVERVRRLAESIDHGIHKHGVVETKHHGKIYAYEVNACGNYMVMDDANIPSLLSLPYLEYTSPVHDPNHTIRDNTRQFVLSSRNKYYYKSEKNDNRGIGSSHTKSGSIWHLSIIMQALTSTSDDELRYTVDMLQRTAVDNLMHESFHASNPVRYTRKSFAWANSLFAELISTRLDDIVRVMTMNATKKATNSESNLGQSGP